MKILAIFLVCLSMIQCTNPNLYKIKKSQVGQLTANTTSSDLSNIFSKDSIFFPLKGDKDLMYSTCEVYTKKGKHLLTVNLQKKDSIFRVDNVQIYYSKYKTNKGLSIKSNFKNIEENYDINKIETTFSSAIIFINELNATITIDKKELGIPLNTSYKIVKQQIPDLAKFKYFTIWMN